MLSLIQVVVVNAGGGRLSAVQNLFMFFIRLVVLELFMWVTRETGTAENAATRAEAYRMPRRTELAATQATTAKPAEAKAASSSGAAQTVEQVRATAAAAAASPGDGKEEKQVPPPNRVVASNEAAVEAEAEEGVELEVLPEVPGLPDPKRPALSAVHLKRCAQVTVGEWKANSCTLSLYWHWRQLAVTVGDDRLVLPFDALLSVHVEDASAVGRAGGVHRQVRASSRSL